MKEAAVILSLLSLALAALAYWRSGGKRDIQTARAKLADEIELIRAKQNELSDALMIALEEAYEISSQTLHQTTEGLKRLREQAIEGLEQQIERTAEQLHSLEQRLEEGLKSVRKSTVTTAQRIYWTLRRRVRRVDARGSLLYAKAAALLANRGLEKGEFQRAEQRLDEATALLALARETLRADHAYDAQFEAVKRALAEATTAVRARADDARQRIQLVVAETDTLLGALESDERQAAEKKPA